jgi:hypothetical protein
MTTSPTAFLAVITRVIRAIDVLPHYTTPGRRYGWYLSGTCR